MPTILTTTGIQFPNSTTQTTNVTGVADLGALLSVSAYPSTITSGGSSFTYTPSVPTTSPAAVTWNTLGTGISVSGSSPYTITDSVATQDWNGSAYSTESGTNVFAQGTPSQTNLWWMIGLTRTPGASYTAIEYALYFNTDGGIYIYESGSSIGNFGKYDTTTVGRVTYDGAYIRYYADAAGTRPIRVVAVAGLTGLKIQASSYGGGSMNNVYFGACTQIQGSTAVVKLIGAGGGGAGYCESGAAGGYAETRIDTTSVNSVAVTIGAAGAGIGYYAAAGSGGTTSFGAYATATGGGGSNSYSAHSGGFGGLGSGGNVNLRGGAGSGHTNSVNVWSGGRGGFGYFGGGGPFSRATATKIYNGAFGAGGPGARTDGSETGGGGENGSVLVYTYK